MEQEDRIEWKQFKVEVKGKLTQLQYKLLCRLHSKYYNHTYYEPCSCRPKELVRWIADIDNLYNK